MNKHCSTVVDCKIIIKIQCVHCEVINYASQTMDDDASKLDIAEITCWGCGRDSLIDESLLELYPEYPNESVGGHQYAKSSPDYT